ncbi:MAG: hypothetical protein GXO08_02715 [Aquificae bacterium]|nr:hypothetical protein [Aquificota bacterium]
MGFSKKTFASLILAFLGFWGCTGGGGGDLNQTQTVYRNEAVEQLFLIYLNADNNLDPFADQDLDEIAQVSFPPSVKVVVLVDRLGNGVGYVYETNEFGKLELVRTVAEPNMGDPKTLISFVVNEWPKYPNATAHLIFWNHGTGWRSSLSTDYRAASYDETPYDLLYTYELREALDQIRQFLNKTFATISFDECLMGNLEVFYAVYPFADYLIASEQLEPGDGWNYQSVFSKFLSYLGTYNASFAFAKAVVDAYAEYDGNYAMSLTMAAVPSEAVPILVEAVDELAKLYLGNPTLDPAYRNARDNTPVIDDYQLADLYHFAKNLNGSVNSTAPERITATVESLYRFTNDENYQGISIYFPNDPALADQAYFCNASNPCDGYYNPFADTFWDEFLKTFLGL